MQPTPKISFITQLLLFLLFSSGWLACRPEPANEEVSYRQSKIFAEFFVRYLAPEQQLRGQASFWEGVSPSNRQPVLPEGPVSFEGRPMESKPLPGNHIRFSRTDHTNYEEQMVFHFRMPEGRDLKYELKMTPVRDFFIKGEISKSNGTTLVVNGGLMNKEESLVLLFTDTQQKATAITIPGPTTDIELTLSPEQLQDLTPGVGKLYLMKKLDKKESHPNLELTAAVEYYTDSRLIEVIP